MSTAALADDAQAAFLAGVAAVDPTRLVKAAVREGRLDDWFGDLQRPRPLHVVALGKAAPRMLWGLVEASVPFRGIGAAPRGVRVTEVDTFHWHIGEHPVPGPGSFAAGRALLDWAAALPSDARVLVLLSGGASACVEVAEGDEDDLVASWRSSWAAGQDIATMNAQRAKHSLLKDGGLARRLLERTPHVRTWVLADTPPEDAAWVGGGPCTHADVAHHVLAGVERAVEGAGQALAASGYAVYGHGQRIAGDLTQALDGFLAAFRDLGPGPAALIGGGEPTIALRDDAPPGGRNQHAALQAASRLQEDEVMLAAGTDGIDGTTKEAGAWSDASLAGSAADTALATQDAHRFLEEARRTLRTGATGTNVGDLWIALRP